MDDHLKYAELISASLDGALSPEEQAQLDAHLTQCPECRALLEDLTAIHAQMAEMAQISDGQVPDGLRERIMAAVEADNVIPFALKRTGNHWKRWAVTAAALALVVAGAWGLRGSLSGGASANAAPAAPAAAAPKEAAAVTAETPGESAKAPVMTVQTSAARTADTAPESGASAQGAGAPVNAAPEVPAAVPFATDVPSPSKAKTETAGTAAPAPLQEFSSVDAGAPGEVATEEVVPEAADVPAPFPGTDYALFPAAKSAAAEKEEYDLASVKAPLTPREALEQVTKRVNALNSAALTNTYTEEGEQLRCVNALADTGEVFSTVIYDGLDAEGGCYLFHEEGPDGTVLAEYGICTDGTWRYE